MVWQLYLQYCQSFFWLCRSILLPFYLLVWLLFFAYYYLKKSNTNQKKLPNFLLLLCALSSLFILGKLLLIKDEVLKDAKFEKEKIETKKETKKELEDLEKDLK